MVCSHTCMCARQAFIPRRLEEVAHYERDQAAVQKAGTGNVEGIYYQVSIAA